MADRTSTYPEAWDFDAWRRELRSHGEVLLSYDGQDGDKTEAAQEPLRWVADHLPLLWD